MFQLFAVKEAVASVAIEHPSSCDCTTCRAAAGDAEAFRSVAASMALDKIKCKEITDSGARCSRNVGRDEDYCWQHQD